MDDDSSLDTLLARATNPLCRELDMEAVQRLCERILLERDGSHQALRFLAHKIQSPQEREAMQALQVLEECANRCGAKFQDELGKFRFLNELIKVVSPKYLGNRASQRVKQKIIEVLYRWSIEMKHHAKIHEAYQMLKRQGVIAVDPVYVIEDYEPGPAPAPRSQSAVFEDEEKSKMLQKLLQSKNPEDLQAANRLIRNMVKEADRRMEMLARRATEIETVHNNAKVLKDMLANYRPGETSAEEQDLMKELFESCERLRPKLFRLAGEMEEKDEGLNEILTANDELTNVINIYKKTMGLEPAVNGGSSTTALNDTHAVSAAPVTAAAAGSLLDLGSLGPDVREEPKKVPVDLSLLDDQLLALGIGDPGPPTATSSMADLGSLFSPGLPQASTNASAGGAAGAGPFGGFGNAAAPSRLPGYSPSHQAVAQPTMLAPGTASGLLSSPLRPTPSYIQQGNHINNIGNGNSNAAMAGGSLLGKSRGLEELDALGQSLIKQALPHNPGSQGDFPTTPQKIPLNQMSRPLLAAASSSNILASAGVFQPMSVGPKTLALGPSMLAPMEGHPPGSPSKMATDDLLNNLFVPLEQIQPGSQAPVNLHEENGVRAVIHIARNRPQEHVSVLVVSVTSQSSLPVRRIAFQATVPKTMRIKLQPPSATELPPHNPILPAAAITQVLLIANPAKDHVRLKYKLSYAIEEENHTHSGEVDCPVDTATAATS
nr:ADP-ribosylation factor-binding protein GGA2-like [Rhipicephalus microplus]